MALIDALAKESGIDRRADGKTVWFSLSCRTAD
jgi:hypothetical protein